MTWLFSCIGCERTLVTESGQCPHCSQIRIEARIKAAICRKNRCGHFVICPSGGDGCDLHPSKKPGRLRAHQQNGGGCFDPVAPLFDATPKPPPPPPPHPLIKEIRRHSRPHRPTPKLWPPSPLALQGRGAGGEGPSALSPQPGARYPSPSSLPAVTSLSLLPHHLARQTTCLNSWKLIGLPIIAVNTPAEIEQLRGQYPQVSQWIESTDVTQNYSRQTQKITSLADVAVKLNRQILLINSDIEIIGAPSVLMSAVATGDCVVGIRHNFKQSPADAKPERHGLDAFTFTPEQAAALPRLGFGIGRPMWDYWLPIHHAQMKYRSRYIGQPFFYHLAHKPFWSQAEWSMGEKWVHDHYGVIDMTAMRKSLPYPP